MCSVIFAVLCAHEYRLCDVHVMITCMPRMLLCMCVITSVCVYMLIHVYIHIGRGTTTRTLPALQCWPGVQYVPQ